MFLCLYGCYCSHRMKQCNMCCWVFCFFSNHIPQNGGGGGANFANKCIITESSVVGEITVCSSALSNSKMMNMVKKMTLVSSRNVCRNFPPEITSWSPPYLILWKGNGRVIVVVWVEEGMVEMVPSSVKGQFTLKFDTPWFFRVWLKVVPASFNRYFQAGGSPENVIQLLSDNYTAVAQTVNLLAEWLIQTGMFPKIVGACVCVWLLIFLHSTFIKLLMVQAKKTCLL